MNQSMFDLDYKKTTEDISNWIHKTVTAAGFSKVIIALSGGIDSAVSCALAVNALGKENVNCVLLPFGQLSNSHTTDSMFVINHLQIPTKNVITIDIKKSVEAIQKTQMELSNSDKTQNIRQSGISDESDSQTDRVKSEFYLIRLGNIMARVRMIYLFDFAKREKVLVCGTENKTEHYLGYFTRFGDEASDIEPIRSFYKTQVWELGKYLGLPERIIRKAPTAGLWEKQTDEGEFGFSYKKADEILFYHFEEHLSQGEIVKKGLDKEIVEKVLQRVKANEFKRELPYIFK